MYSLYIKFGVLCIDIRTIEKRTGLRDNNNNLSFYAFKLSHIIIYVYTQDNFSVDTIDMQR